MAQFGLLDPRSVDPLLKWSVQVMNTVFHTKKGDVRFDETLALIACLCNKKERLDRPLLEARSVEKKMRDQGIVI